MESLPQIPDCLWRQELGDPQGPSLSQSKHVTSSPQFPVSNFNIYSRVPKPGGVMFFVFYKPDKWFRFVHFIVHFAFYFLKKFNMHLRFIPIVIYIFTVHSF